MKIRLFFATFTIALFIAFAALFFLMPQEEHAIQITPTISQIDQPKNPLPTMTVTTPTPTPIREITLHDVPFTAQAPEAQWSNSIYQDGCEEASILMAMHWVNNKPIDSPMAASQAIADISNFEVENYGEYRDRSAADTAQLIRDYYDYHNVKAVPNIVAEDIIREIQQGNIVIVPADGRHLGNPNFTPPYPDRHMVVVRGYDPVKHEFITNDPGTRLGELYRYPVDVFFNAIRDYPTGYHKPVEIVQKIMIVIKPSESA